MKARCEVAESAVHKKSNEVTRLETESESAKTNVTEFANALEVDAENTFSRNDFTAFVGTKEAI